MFRLLPLIAFATLPALVAAPVPREAPASFGSHGTLTPEDLARVKFDSRLVKDADKHRPAEEIDLLEEEPKKVRPKNRYDVAVHMPVTKFRVGEEIPVYFVVRNNRGFYLFLDARLDFFGEQPITWNSCEIELRHAKTGEPVEDSRLRGMSCGHRELLTVHGDGYYCAKADFSLQGNGKPLPSGEYEISWRCGSLASAPVRFSVLDITGAKPVARTKRPHYHYFHIQESHEEEVLVKRIDDPPPSLSWKHTALEFFGMADFAASLAAGEGGVVVPDIHAIPVSDQLVRVEVEWQQHRDGDRVFVTLHPAVGQKAVCLSVLPQLYLQVETSDTERRHLRDRSLASKQLDELVAVFDAPLTIEARLPKDWRDWVGAHDTAKVAVVVSTQELQKHGRHLVNRVRQDREAKHDPDAVPVWCGVVRSESKELQFPPRLPFAIP
jgi:hypothetical protein